MLRIENRPVTIVGVLPAGFYEETAVWQARHFSGDDARSARFGHAGNRATAAGRDVASGQSRARCGDTAHPAMDGPTPVPERVVIESMYDDETSPFGATIRTLSMAVGLILMIACVNVAGLHARAGRHARGRTGDPGVDRRRTRAVVPAVAHRKSAARHRRRARLACCSRMCHSTRWSRSFRCRCRPIHRSPINGTVLAFALGLTVVTALLFGLVPALKLSRAPKMISTTLAVGGRGGAPLSKRAGQWLIGVEVALALVLMTGAGLILRSFAKLLSVDLGFDAVNVLTLEVEPLDQTAAVRRDYYASLANELRRLPEVASAGAIDQTGLDWGRRYGFSRRTPALRSKVRSGPCCLDISRRWACALSQGDSCRMRTGRPAKP